MPRPAQYRDVDVPENFAEWDEQGQINYLQGAMDRQQMANFVRDLCELDSREKPLLRKDELAEIAVTVVNSQ
jgi:hypothetical protein